MMAEIDAGVLPVAENNQPVGMITDRDIAVRAVAQGSQPAGQALAGISQPSGDRA